MITSNIGKLAAMLIDALNERSHGRLDQLTEIEIDALIPLMKLAKQENRTGSISQ